MLELETEQERLEYKTITDAQHKVALGFVAIVEQGRLAETNLGASLLKISLEPVVEAIKEYFMIPLRGKFKVDKERLRLLFEGREKELAYIVLNTVLTNVAKEPLGLVSISKKIVKDINQVIAVEKLKENDPKVYSFIDYEFKKRGKAFIKKRKVKLAMIKGFDEDSIDTTTKLGGYLVSIVVNSGIDLFQVTENYKNMHKVSLTDKAMKVLFKHKKTLLHTVLTYVPMVVEPRPHTELYGNGGYILPLNNLSIVKQKRSFLRIIEKDFNSNSERLFKVINKVQSVAWSVNTRVLDVMSYIIDNNLLDPKSHRLNPKLFGGIPTFESLDVNEMIQKKDYGEIGTNGKFLKDEDYDRYYRDKTHQEGVIEKIVGNRYSYMFAIDLAKRYTEYKKFYFTYQFDYRYRLYPLQQHLNPQQSGNLKALLQFHEGCILNEKGLYWLKIHGANCYGYDKEPYNVRVEKINEMIPMIKAVAEDPLAHLEYWVDTDSPFEYLAFCFSISDYFKDSNATIHIPVALDATCSGIQIYSGLLRDGKGAKAVNVIGSTREDVYGDVAEVGNQLLNDNDYPKELVFNTSDGVQKTINTQLEASSLRGNVTRKLTKRNVMTTPYSVTSRGMFDQVKGLLTEDELDGNIWWKGDKWVVAKVLADVNARAISKVVEGAIKGQNYIKQVTQTIASKDEYLRWNSPIFNLPMLQRVPKENKSKVRTPFGELIFYKETENINKQKMLSSIAPNFIHNLDATLMYLTVEKCIKDGVDNFWLIHDSYGVLPNDVDSLNKNVREAYVELFSQDILKDWVEQLGLEFDEDVMINTLNLNDVYASEYIFS